MDKLQDFKSIADEMMSDIKVGDELREKTLRRCREEPQKHFGRVLLPAAGFLLAAGIFGITQLLTFPDSTASNNSSASNTLMAADAGTQIMQGESANSVKSQDYSFLEWQPDTLIEAGTDFGDAFLTPGYLPDNFKLEQIQALGVNENSADKILMSYVSGNRSYLITQEKSKQQDSYQGFDQITINGINGFLSSTEAEGVDDESVYTELYWYTDEAQYSVTGLISADEAVKIAKAMEQ
jgi:hypothetical protein